MTDSVPNATVAKLRKSVIDPLKEASSGRDEVIDLIFLAIVAREHLFLFGPPGTAKSALIRQFRHCSIAATLSIF